MAPDTLGVCATLLVSVSGITQPSPGCHDAELALVFGKEVQNPTKALQVFSCVILPLKRGSVTIPEDVTSNLAHQLLAKRPVTIYTSLLVYVTALCDSPSP